MRIPDAYQAGWMLRFKLSYLTYRYSTQVGPHVTSPET